MGRTKFFAIGCAVALALSACGADDTPQSNPSQPSTSTGEQQTIGDVFLNSNLKIQSKIRDTSVEPVRDIVVELYVDSKGNGSGMLGFGETVCDVKVVQDILYIVLDDETVVNVSDLSGRCVVNQEELEGCEDMASKGFSVVGETPVSYSARIGSLTIDTTFAQSTQTFEPASLATENVMGFEEAIDYAIDYYTSSAVDVDAPDDEEDLVSHYIKSPYGVTIEGELYSVGDTCNPSTYFEERVPEGLLTSSEYKEDMRVDFVHASYISDTGRTTFTLASNYVQAIETNTAFEWLGLSYGMDAKELKYVLGWHLSSKEEEGWTPINEDLVVTAYNKNTYHCTIGTLNVELRVDSKEGLSSIYIERPLEYRGPRE